MKFIAKSNLPLLDALQSFYPDSSKTTLRSWLKDGRVKVNDHVEKHASTAISPGDSVVVGEKQRIIKEGIRILYQDAHIVVIDKPAGLLSVSTDFDKQHNAHRLLNQQLRPRRVHVVHRLDQETSGVMLFALTEKARDALKDIFEAHAIERAYTAVVEGSLKQHQGTWQSYLYEDGAYFVHQTEDPEKGRLAITHYQVLKRSPAYTLIELRLETGRKNQIRVHCQDAGHPVVGDKKYGAKTNHLKRLCLHAHLLAFKHPITKADMSFTSDVPPQFFKFFKLNRPLA